MDSSSHFRLQLVVFTLVAAAFANIYLTQPILPFLQQQFNADMVWVALTVSAVIFGIALTNLPFGFWAEKGSILPIVLTGGVMVALAGIVCATAQSLELLIAARFVQGCFIPALTTCLAAFLAQTLPAQSLNVVMGSYVSATVLGGLGSRLIGGWLFPPSQWRSAFWLAAILILAATLLAFWGLPRPAKEKPLMPTVALRELVTRWDLLPIYGCAAGGMALFAAIFNFLPFRLTRAPFLLSTNEVTLLYLAYIVGIFMGPLAGKVSQRIGSGPTFILGSTITGIALVILWIPSITATVAGLILLCTGFFAFHATAVGTLNSRLSSGQGRANALYVLFYYLGGWLGITICGPVYQYGGWGALLGCCALFTLFPLMAGIIELNR